jgi:hypothetical protein
VSGDDDARPVALEAPRALSTMEAALVDLLIAPLHVPELSAQVAAAEVVSACSCGCPSVGLRTDGAAVPEDVMRRLSESGRSDVLSLSTVGTDEQGRTVDIVLHLVHGLIEELEVWAQSATPPARR